MTRTPKPQDSAPVAPAPSPAADNAAETLLDHVVLEVQNVAETATFYESILGFPAVRMGEYLAGEVPFVSGRVNEGTVIDYFPKALWRDPSHPANPNHICLTMPQPRVAALKRRMQRRGVPITRRQPRNFGAQGWGRSIYFEDPNGVTVEVRYYGKNAKESPATAASPGPPVPLAPRPALAQSKEVAKRTEPEAH